MVIAIIGILASIVLVSLSGAQKKGRDAKRTADMKNIQLALALYYSDHGMYPQNIYGNGASAPTMGLAPSYISVVPRDPSASGASCNTASANTTEGCYRYNAYKLAGGSICNGTTNLSSTYHLGAIMEETTSGVLIQDVDADAADLNPPYSVDFVACGGTGNPPTSSFEGTGADRGPTAGTETNCYDLIP